MGAIRMPYGPCLMIYKNDPATAKRIGWADLPEYCRGDPTAPYVVHDHIHGRFYFAQMEITGDKQSDS